ncbi:Transposase (orf1) [Streptococcus oralis]|uniref:Transposase (Orf1) n=1 Tax=Streptococcus oralis TaxID=1303 RepID=A0A139PBH5_STROR|nr:Transposase (orf1) [Streptococcus oralis]
MFFVYPQVANFILELSNLLGIKDKNILILDYVDTGTHKEIIAKLDYPAAPKCQYCQGQIVKISKKNPKFPI